MKKIELIMCEGEKTIKFSLSKIRFRRRKPKFHKIMPQNARILLLRGLSGVFYAKSPEIKEGILNVDPLSSFSIRIERDNDYSIFENVYILYDALKENFEFVSSFLRKIDKKR